MNTITFDTHQFVKKLQAKGISEEQSEAIVDVVKESRNDAVNSLSTKSEMQQFKSELKYDMSLLEGRLEARIKEEIAGVKADIATVKSDVILLKYGMGYLIAAITGLGIKTIFFG